MQTQDIIFENHYNVKVVEVQFPNGFNIATPEDISTLKEAWVKNLKRWHSPYTCLFDLRDFKVESSLAPDFRKLISFFKSFFMRKIIGFSNGEKYELDLGFEIFLTYEEAVAQTRLSKGAGLNRDLTSLRECIQIENDFTAHVMEISFKQPSEIKTAEDVETFKSKLRNNLRLWHSPYSIIVDCSDLSMSPDIHPQFQQVERFLKMFFCKGIVGYSPKEAKDTYPFRTFRARHAAAAQLKNEGITSGEVANCSTRKTNPTP